jgi:hypothetical protein
MNITSIHSQEARAVYLRTLPAIRERCGRVHELAKEGKLQYLDYHPEKEADVAEFCVKIMKVSYCVVLSSMADQAPQAGLWDQFLIRKS